MSREIVWNAYEKLSKHYSVKDAVYTELYQRRRPAEQHIRKQNVLLLLRATAQNVADKLVEKFASDFEIISWYEVPHLYWAAPHYVQYIKESAFIQGMVLTIRCKKDRRKMLDYIYTLEGCFVEVYYNLIYIKYHPLYAGCHIVINDDVLRNRNNDNIIKVL